jgi:hypothetical protein
MNDNYELNDDEFLSFVQAYVTESDVVVSGHRRLDAARTSPSPNARRSERGMVLDCSFAA